MNYYPKVILPIIRNLQDTHYSCGASSLKMILDTLGIIMHEHEIMKLTNTTPELGASTESIQNLLNKLNVKFNVIEDMSIEILVDKIRDLNLCLVCYQAWGLTKKYKI